jgi:flagellar hook-associated protein 1 FlgK
VADGLNAAHNALAGQFAQTRTQLSAYSDEVNTAAKTIAQLNSSIVKAKATGITVNELEDQRDSAVMHLSELTGATAALRKNGAMDVFIGNSTLVSEFTTRDTKVSGATTLLSVGTAGPVALNWADSTTPVGAGGTMGGMLDTLTRIIPITSGKLDKVAQNLADSVNALHSPAFGVHGSTGVDFFVKIPSADPTFTAANIRVGITDPDEVAVSSTDPRVIVPPATSGSLDNTVADALADLGDAANGPDREYQGMIGRLGVDSQATSRRSDIQNNVTEQVDASREAQSGVNLDEEMTNLLTFQRGYEAASRVLTTIDSMLDQLINRTGLVGR